MANLKFKGNVFFHPRTFFPLHNPYSFCSFNFDTKFIFLNILLIELERGDRKSKKNDNKRENVLFHHFSDKKLIFLGIIIFHSMR